MSLTRDHIISAYELFLERMPENDSVIEQKLHCGSINNLCQELVLSREFAEKHPVIPLGVDAWVIVESKEGFRIWVNLADLNISWQIIRGRFELSETAFVHKYLKPGDTALDIGANIGFYSLLMSKIVGTTGRVIGFEALDFLYHAAQNSIHENKFENCELHNVALSATEGIATMVYAPGSSNFGGAFLSPDGSVLQNHASVTVKAMPLFHYLEGISVDFIKIDIEGSEYPVLNACKEYLIHHKPIIMTEVLSLKAKKNSELPPHEYVHFLNSIGYNCYYIAENGDLGEKITASSFSGNGMDVISIACMP